MLWQHWTNHQFWWFQLTAGFMGVSALIVYAMAIAQVWTIRRRLTAWDYLQIFITYRYITVIIEPAKRMDDSEKPDPCTLLLARLRYVETITENAPQLCLQVYIMLHQQYFPPSTVISSVLSLLALTWCITVVEEEKRQGEFMQVHTCIHFFLLAIPHTFIKRIYNHSICLRYSIFPDNFHCTPFVNNNGDGLSKRGNRKA